MTAQGTSLLSNLFGLDMYLVRPVDVGKMEQGLHASIPKALSSML